MSRSRAAGVQKDETTNTWWFVADVGRTAKGRRKQAKRRGFATKKAAQVGLDRLRVGVHDQAYVAPQKLTLAQYVEGWLNSLETVQGRRPSTMASYRRNPNNHVLPWLGGVRVQDLSAEHLNRMYAELPTTGNLRTGKALAPRTVRYIHTIIGKALADAVQADAVVRNVSKRAKPPSAKSAKAAEQRWWKPDELSVFLTATRDDSLHPLFRLAAMTGMRRGEVCGLAWEHLDLDAGMIHVRQQLPTVDHVITIAPHLKTDHGRRSIDIDPDTTAVLRCAPQAPARAASRPRCGLTGDRDGLHPPGRLMGGSRVSSPCLLPPGPPLRPAQNPFPRLETQPRAHLIAAGQDALVISRRLGHHSVAFTLDKYGHLMPKASSGAAAAVAKLVDATRL